LLVFAKRITHKSHMWQNPKATNYSTMINTVYRVNTERIKRVQK